ncbi:MAG: YtxH domain-containing protein [Anaerolineae bacterium]|jgi:gas vesicle protein|nr:YtxH domain-containing protein [Anaerolineae bacterium]
MRKTLSFIAGLLVGVVTGGSLALLLAPVPGPELQHRAQDYFNRLIEEGKAAAEARRAELETQLEAFKQGKPLGSDTPQA